MILPEIPRELEIQDLKEIIEIGSQITAQLDVENIVRNVVLSLVAKFQISRTTVVVPSELDEDVVTFIHYKGLKKEDLKLKIPSIVSLLSFLDQDEYNQISFSYFRENFKDQAVIEELEQLEPDIVIPLRTDKGVAGMILLPGKEDQQEYSLLDIQYITQIVRFAAIAIENAHLYWQATTDRMTKLFSHHYFQKILDDEMNRAHRYSTTFSLIMLDIDFFKQFNDTYGHLQGDIIIKDIAKILRRTVRNIDFSARYGGEEFAVVLPEVDAEGAAVVAERIRKSIEDSDFSGEEGPVHVTVSMGVAEFKPKKMRSPSQIIAEADKALYQSKETGRNRVTVARQSFIG